MAAAITLDGPPAATPAKPRRDGCRCVKNSRTDTAVDLEALPTVRVRIPWT